MRQRKYNFYLHRIAVSVHYLIDHQLAMPTSEKFCLKWNDFQENVNTAFESLRKDNDFTDVTLACDDGFQADAHKVILASSSPFFQNLLKRNEHLHPLIYMRGLKSNDLVAILDFLYFGETNIYQENLNTFLSIAEELDLKGLNGKDEEENRNITKPAQERLVQERTKQVSQNMNNSAPKNVIVSEFDYGEQICTTEMTITQPKEQFSGNMQELDEKLDSMMTLGNNNVHNRRATICQVCGKEGMRITIKDHIEANHLEGISIPCKFCEKTFR